MRAGTGVISTQVLHEYVNVALRKLALPVELIRSRLALYSRLELVAASVQLLTEDMNTGAVIAGVRLVNPFVD